MRLLKFLLLLSLITLVVSAAQNNSSEDESKSYSQYVDYLIQQVLEFISKFGMKVLVNPKLLRTEVKIIVQKVLKVSLTKSTLKKVPVAGALAGIGFGIWRAFYGEYKRAAAQVVSGFAGAVGIGIPGSIAIDVFILIADVVECLKEQKIIQSNEVIPYQQKKDEF